MRIDLKIVSMATSQGLNLYNLKIISSLFKSNQLSVQTTHILFYLAIDSYLS